MTSGMCTGEQESERTKVYEGGGGEAELYDEQGKLRQNCYPMIKGSIQTRSTVGDMQQEEKQYKMIRGQKDQ